jgi:hypothetical protein
MASDCHLQNCTQLPATTVVLLQTTLFVTLKIFGTDPKEKPSSIVKEACLLVLLLSRSRVLRECVHRPVACNGYRHHNIIILTGGRELNEPLILIG